MFLRFAKISHDKLLHDVYALFEVTHFVTISGFAFLTLHVYIFVKRQLI